MLEIRQHVMSLLKQRDNVSALPAYYDGQDFACLKACAKLRTFFGFSQKARMQPFVTANRPHTSSSTIPATVTATPTSASNTPQRS